jgi:hypothetical protein
MRKLLLVWIAVIAGCQFGAASPQKDVVIQFYELREKTLDQRGTKLDLDKLLSLLTDDVRYEHPMALVVMTKAQARQECSLTCVKERTHDTRYGVLAL